jgi:acetyl-CoA synthetase
MLFASSKKALKKHFLENLVKSFSVVSDIEKFWGRQAEKLTWFKKWDKVLSWNEPFAKWFEGGTLNASHLCLDVHMNSWRKNKVALHWEDEQGKTVSLSYAQLYREVNRFASVLKKLGVKKGDRIILYISMLPEAFIAMLASARIGAIHSVVFSGFGSQALADRINDAGATIVITADFGLRRGKLIPIKSVVDEALELSSTVQKVIVVKRTEKEVEMKFGRDNFYHDLMKTAENYVEPEHVDATDPLFILYTSGTTGKPKGIVHSTGGYLVYINSVFKWAFNLNDESVYWCTADVGWVTGHSFVLYAPLMQGSTIVAYEGTPDYPAVDKWWELIEKYRVTTFYTAPTAIRMLMRHGTEWLEKHDLSSLKTLGTVGETINPEVWKWYQKYVGAGKCPVIDTWWQTETGGFMISPTLGLDLVPLKPGSATKALPGIDADVVDAHGNIAVANQKGFLVIKKPWPGMLMGIYNDPQRYKDVYWSKFKGMYYSGDSVKKDKDGYFWLLGRADEALNISGHIVGTAEVESAAVATDCVAEAAVVGVPDDLKGEAIILFAILKKWYTPNDELKRNVSRTIRRLAGPHVTPREIYFIDKLPKTRSGKIMRRVLKSLVLGASVGDVSTIEDEASIEEIRTVYNEFKNIVKVSGQQSNV